ncbi:UPF0149 family protein [Sphingopyxis sp. RIFCSPHIGHO2_12_FULL_65_19]|uniref:UPF0149 family protein n=1 Tax=Sphingopyxis sp. RIFCSPHIGHO2_12_FULL_65_19 TaxID=1802172 RepID=UPI0008BF6281|nr:UPF0149 family protein [Sphingopyxis sp. RIFCSPHIGHO2_12_FULL_65_19]OHD05224.1 MAG: hypothetical protein A3E77_01610 [Sphingopyxis sp. RIFCSPHIGHO2_12_FULL_65_19]
MQDYLDQLDHILLHQFDEGMLLSELDGYLTGIIVSPDLVPQSKWLKKVWGDAPPKFDSMEEMQGFLDLLMRHYNGILGDLSRPGAYGPVLDVDRRNGDTLWELWIDGFVQAMKLSPIGWNRIRASDDAAVKGALAGITELSDNRSTVTAAADSRSEAVERLSTWVELLHEWRLKNDENRSKVGRNDPCPCGSGKKYKKCCGLN